MADPVHREKFLPPNKKKSKQYPQGDESNFGYRMSASGLPDEEDILPTFQNDPFIDKDGKRKELDFSS